ncbi:cell division protein FtsZ [Gammaproteobacteria bacterium]
MQQCATPIKLPLGTILANGFGTNANPDIGHKAALETRDRILEVIRGTDLLFIVAGMGGGTGTGAAPVVAELARELGILTVAVVTKPFSHEGDERRRIAEQGIEALVKQVDSLITISNERLLSLSGRDTRHQGGFKAVNDMSLNAVRGLAELIAHPGLINIDIDDVRVVMANRGTIISGTGRAAGENRAKIAAEAAIDSRLYGDITGATGILVSICSGPDLSLQEFNEVGDVARELADEDATIVVGTITDEDMQDEIRVTLFATGLRERNRKLDVPNTQIASIRRKRHACSPQYVDLRIEEEHEESQKIGVAMGNGSADKEEGLDVLFDEAVYFVTETRRASISGVQRKFKISYNRAARMIEDMERAGIVGPVETNGNREVLAPPPPDVESLLT